MDSPVISGTPEPPNILAAEGAGCLPESKRLTKLDRFIPQNTSQKAYKAATYLHLFNVDNTNPLSDSPRTPKRMSSPEFFTNLNDTSYYEAMRANQTLDTSIDALDDSRESTTRQRKKPKKVIKQASSHRRNLARSLELGSKSSVFMFRPQDSGGQIDVHKNLTNFTKQLCLDRQDDQNATTNTRNCQRSKSQVPYRILDAPSLRNDFYTNLIAWSKWSNKVIVGLGSSVYIWSEEDGTIPILKHNYLAERKDFITCVTFSPHTDDIVIGTKLGFILVFANEDCTKYYKNNKNYTNLNPTDEIQKESSKGIACIEWFKTSTEMFIIGGESGEVSIAKIGKGSGYRSRADIISSFQAHSQQICGMSNLFCF